MIEKVEGIVISESAYGDTSKIINVFTKEHGIIGVMCKGAKSLKSKLRAVTTKFTYGYFHLYYKENKLSTLITVDIIDELKNIHSDITLISYASYITELTTQVYKQNNYPEIYSEYLNALLKIDNKLDPMIITNILEVKLLDYLGVGLNLDSCTLCGNKTNIITLDPDHGGYVCQNCYTNEQIVDVKTIKMIRMYYLVELKSITSLKVSDKVKNEINYFLNKYYERYTGLYLYSKNFLEKIVNMN